MNKASKPVAGFSADTEILTRTQGWVRFDQITAFDEVATRTPDGEFRWEHPERVIWQPYAGDMVWFHSRTADMLAAPAQRILYRKRERVYVAGKLRESVPTERAGAAADFPGSRVALIATSCWEPRVSVDRITLAPKPVRSDGKRNVGKPPLKFAASTSDFAAFMGMYLSEGYLGSSNRPGEYPINISQSPKGKGFGPYQERLDHMLGRPVPWLRPGSGVFRFANKALYEFLKTCGGYAWTKRIPCEVLELGPEDLETFWHFAWLGDGSMMSSAGRKDIEVMQTTSKDMADSFQEILQKLGTWSKIHRVAPSALNGNVDGRPIKARHTLFRLVRRAGDVAFATYVERVPYCGQIGCVSVSAPAVYVRRNDHPVWAGSA